MSTLRVNTLQNTSGVEVYTAKAWVNFNGTGTVAIRAAGNVSSITDNGTGDYTLNFTTALADANYSVSGIIGETAGLNFGNAALTAPTSFSYNTGSVRVRTPYSDGNGLMTANDYNLVCFSIFR